MPINVIMFALGLALADGCATRHLPSAGIEFNSLVSLAVFTCIGAAFRPYMLAKKFQDTPPRIQCRRLIIISDGII